MAKVQIYTSENGQSSQAWFYCPGCKQEHAFTIKWPGDSNCWAFNGDVNKPTFSPSLLCNGQHPESRCHSFVTDGKIQFLGDCYHELKNQTVELEDVPDGL